MSVKPGFLHGYFAGVGLNLPVSERFALLYEANFVTKGSAEDITVINMGGETLPKPAEMHITYRINYVEFPILTKYELIKSEPVKIGITSGIALNLKIYGRHRLRGKVYFPDSDGYSIIRIKEASNLSNISLFDYTLVYGGEAGFRLYNKDLAIGYRFTVGMDELLLPTFQTLGLAPVKLRNMNYLLYLKTPLW